MNKFFLDVARLYIFVWRKKSFLLCSWIYCRFIAIFYVFKNDTFKKNGSRSSVCSTCSANRFILHRIM